MEIEAQGASCAVDKSCCGGDEKIVEKPDVSVDACTAEPEMVAEGTEQWKRVFSHLQGHSIESTKAVFRFANTTETKSRLTALIAVERICCAHVDWQLTETTEQLSLTLKSDADSLPKMVKFFVTASDTKETN